MIPLPPPTSRWQNLAVIVIVASTCLTAVGFFILAGIGFCCVMKGHIL